jgi:methionine sulfoxide reductase heme-binding subunit
VPPGTLLARATPVAWLLCSLPALDLALRAWQGRLTANPIEFVTLRTGYWALVLLMVTLAVTPLRRTTGLNELARYRRGLGLFSFFYASLHLATYVTLDRFFEFREIGADIVKRPYITVGFLAFLLLLPLALTSSRRAIRRLGRNWVRLHRLIYPAAALAILHFYWKKASKADIGEPLVFAAILAVLIAFRLYRRLTAPRRSGERPQSTVTRT